MARMEDARLSLVYILTYSEAQEVVDVEVRGELRKVADRLS